MVTTIDFIVSLSLVAAATAFLAYRLLRPAPPRCHDAALASSAGGNAGGEVVVGAALARGLKRAQRAGARTLPSQTQEQTQK
jgi:hypothetical protein